MSPGVQRRSPCGSAERTGSEEPAISRAPSLCLHNVAYGLSLQTRIPVPGMCVHVILHLYTVLSSYYCVVSSAKGELYFTRRTHLFIKSTSFNTFFLHGFTAAVCVGGGTQGFLCSQLFSVLPTLEEEFGSTPWMCQYLLHLARDSDPR